MEKISVIIPTYKRPSNISEAVRNALSQNYQNFEIIIVDDNGLGTEFQKKTYASLKELLRNYHNVRYVCLETNSGACKARNKGIEEAQGEYIAFLDDDDYWHPHFLSEMISTLKKEASEVVYANFFRMDEHGIYYNRKEEYFSGNVRKKLLKGWCPATTSLFCIKKNLIVNNAGFDDKLRNLEEYDLWIRLSSVTNFSFCEKRLVIKSESQHEQLTNNYDSRIQAWKELKNKWSYSNLTESETSEFFKIIDYNILSESFHKELQAISRKRKYKFPIYNCKRTLLLYIASFLGVSQVSSLQYLLRRYIGPISYLSKINELKVRKSFQILSHNLQDPHENKYCNNML